jgi:flagellar biosynthesis/type III secretory pathway chaperone
VGGNTSPQEAIAELTRLVEQELVASAELESSLENGADSFAGRDAVAIAEGAGRIQSAYEAIIKLEIQRGKLLEQIGFSGDQSGMERLLAILPEKHPFHRKWRSLLEQARRCRDLNEVNARIVESSRHHTEEALKLLRGSTPGSELYGRGGRSHSAVTSRSIGRA